VLVAERDEGDGEAGPLARRRVDVDEALLELVHRDAARVDDPVGDLAEMGERLPLRLDALLHGAGAREGMAPPALVVAPDERLVGRLQEQHLRHVALGPELLEDLDEVGEVGALPHVHAEGDLLDLAARLRAELREGRDQRGGQVVHAEVAEVLEALDRVALPRPREARDDHEAEGLGLAGRRGDAHARGSISPRPPSFRR
jgi:hypothetical protein